MRVDDASASLVEGLRAAAAVTYLGSLFYKDRADGNGDLMPQARAGSWGFPMTKQAIICCIDG